MIIDFLLNVTAVVVGIVAYKKLEHVYEDLRWKYYQRHDSSKDFWESWQLNIKDITIGTSIKFLGCNECTGKSVCYFCKKGVKKTGEVVAVYKEFDIPTVEVKVKGAEDFLELTQDDLDDPCLISTVSIRKV